MKNSVRKHLRIKEMLTSHVFFLALAVLLLAGTVWLTVDHIIFLAGRFEYAFGTSMGLEQGSQFLQFDIEGFRDLHLIPE